MSIGTSDAIAIVTGAAELGKVDTGLGGLVSVAQWKFLDSLLAESSGRQSSTVSW